LERTSQSHGYMVLTKTTVRNTKQPNLTELMYRNTHEDLRSIQNKTKHVYHGARNAK